MAEGTKPSTVSSEDRPIDASDQGRVPAKTADDYRLIYHSEIDGDVLTAWRRTQGPAPKREDREARVRAITSTEYSRRPSNGSWTEQMAKIGVGAKNFYWTDKSCGTNVPDPSNPGFKADSQDGIEMTSAGQGIQNDVNISQQVHKDEVINPRLRFQGTNVVNHFSPVIRRPNPWVLRLLMGVAEPILKVMSALEEEENA